MLRYHKLLKKKKYDKFHPRMTQKTVEQALQNILLLCVAQNSSTVLWRIWRRKMAIKWYLIAMRNKEQCSSLHSKNLSLSPYPIDPNHFVLYLRFISKLKHLFMGDKDLTWSEKVSKPFLFILADLFNVVNINLFISDCSYISLVSNRW